MITIERVESMASRTISSVLLGICYISVILLANAAVQRYGVVPVGRGLTAPAGVFFAGLGFIIRDLLQEVAPDGRKQQYVVGAILLGTLAGGQLRKIG